MQKKEIMQGEETKDKDDKENRAKSTLNIATESVTIESARISTKEAAVKFSKPDSYDRKPYDSPKAKIQAKRNLFKDSGKVPDSYTGEELVQTLKEAKALYGDDWPKHLAESDHIKPVKKVYDEAKRNPWLTNDDIKNAVNSDDNIKVTSRKFNNAKRDRTNKDYVEDSAYLENKGVKLTEKGKQTAINDGKRADNSIKQNFRNSTAKNITSTYHEAGLNAAKEAGMTGAAVSGIRNIVAVIKGEKEIDEALSATVKDGAKATAIGYVQGGGMTVVSHSLSNSSSIVAGLAKSNISEKIATALSPASKFVEALTKSNIPGKVIMAVTATGGTLKRYMNGDISTQECIIELGDSGLNVASMAVGQSLFLLNPVVGAVVGALVGSLVSGAYHNYLNSLKLKELEHQERLRIIAESEQAAKEARAFRAELESYLNEYFQEYQDCFDEAMSEIRFSLQEGDADGAIAGANQITRKLGGNVYYETTEEFKDFLTNDSIDIL